MSLWTSLVTDWVTINVKIPVWPTSFSLRKRCNKAMMIKLSKKQYFISWGQFLSSLLNWTLLTFINNLCKTYSFQRNNIAHFSSLFNQLISQSIIEHFLSYLIRLQVVMHIEYQYHLQFRQFSKTSLKDWLII